MTALSNRKTSIGWVMTTLFAEREKDLLIGSSALTGIFDAALGFMAAMTAMSVVATATIDTAQPGLAPKPA
ncbi:hypothetical protein [Bradyrhizobium manausense]|uniref:hypothetical protein n=1 Tax=Bradyrhizobium manausense TaxID=989370 RepID=UPI002011C445|nr:hypothetical protein [Bradyrhizobium manausense]